LGFSKALCFFFCLAGNKKKRQVFLGEQCALAPGTILATRLR